MTAIANQIAKLFKFPSLGEGLGVGSLGVALLLLTSCSSIDCPVDNLVYTIYDVKTTDGEADTLKSTLNVLTVRLSRDTLVYNQGTNLTQFTLPISYQNPEDTLLFLITQGDTYATLDTVWVNKEDRPHFESVDCSAIFFHELRGVRSTHQAIDTIKIVNPHVNYDHTSAHFQISFKQ